MRHNNYLTLSRNLCYKQGHYDESLDFIDQAIESADSPKRKKKLYTFKARIQKAKNNPYLTFVNGQDMRSGNRHWPQVEEFTLD